MSYNYDVHTAGGVTRVTTQSTSGAPADGPPAAWEATKVHGGALRITAGGDTESAGGLVRHSASPGGTPGGSVIATRARMNGQDTVELEPGLTGSRTLMSQAIKAGLVVEVSPGSYVDARDYRAAPAAGPSGAPAAPSPVPAEVPEVDPGAGVFDHEEDGDWAHDIAPLSQASYDAAQASTTRAVLDGGTFETAAHMLAVSENIDPTLAAEYVQEGYAMYERAAARAIAPVGITEATKGEFYQWARGRRDRLHEAAQRLTSGRDASGFKALAQEFVRQRHGAA